MENIKIANSIFLLSEEFDNHIQKRNINKARSILKDIKNKINNLSSPKLINIIQKIYDLNKKEIKLIENDSG